MPILGDFLKFSFFRGSFWRFSERSSTIAKQHSQMIVNCRMQMHSPEKNLMCGQEVEVVSTCKYLGTIFNNKLNWDENMDAIVTERDNRVSSAKAKDLFS